eukprot:Gb_33582 [translate_table: standard]
MEKKESVGRRKLHVVMLPYLAYGHVNPMVELSKGLSALGVHVSFVSTPVYIAKIRHRFAPGEVQLVELPLPPVEGLPSGHEGTTHLPPHMIRLVRKAVAAMEKPFEALLHHLCPHCVIHDLLIQWTSTALKSRLNISTVALITSSVIPIAYFAQTEGGIESIDGLKLPSSRQIMQPFLECGDRVSSLYKTSSETAATFQQLPIFFNTCVDAIVANSCVEMESKFISYLQTLTETRLFPLGPLIPSSPNGDQGSDNCIQWLEMRAPSSVVFVSLGSECFPSKDEIHSIALGLEASQHPFLWVIRFPTYSEQDSSSEPQVLDASTSLPPGFESRTRDRGLVVEGWANQMQILSHLSTGAFMSHCGWNSLMEGMSLGIPLIALPMQYDQPFNARLIAGELGVGVEVERGNDGSFRMEQIEKAVRHAMAYDSPLRDNAKEFGERIQKKVLGADGSRQKYLLEFIQKLKQISAFNA